MQPLNFVILLPTPSFEEGQKSKKAADEKTVLPSCYFFNLMHFDIPSQSIIRVHSKSKICSSLSWNIPYWILTLDVSPSSPSDNLEKFSEVEHLTLDSPQNGRMKSFLRPLGLWPRDPRRAILAHSTLPCSPSLYCLVGLKTRPKYIYITRPLRLPRT